MFWRLKLRYIVTCFDFLMTFPLVFGFRLGPTVSISLQSQLANLQLYPSWSHRQHFRLLSSHIPFWGARISELPPEPQSMTIFLAMKLLHKTSLYHPFLPFWLAWGCWVPITKYPSPLGAFSFPFGSGWYTSWFDQQWADHLCLDLSHPT